MTIKDTIIMNKHPLIKTTGKRTKTFTLLSYDNILVKPLYFFEDSIDVYKKLNSCLSNDDYIIFRDGDVKYWSKQFLIDETLQCYLDVQDGRYLNKIYKDPYLTYIQFATKEQLLLAKVMI